MSKTTYKSSGVDIDAGNRFVKLIRPYVDSTKNKFTVSGIGGFAGAFSLPKKYRDPLLVSATDGVGTKLRVAVDAGVLDTIGIDLVAMSVNDLLTCGAQPLFFLDYLATSKLNPGQHSKVVKGIARGCRQSGCVLIGGETAEMPGFYAKGDFDLAGFAVGAVEKKGIIDGRRVKPGDTVIGIASSGLHSNGYSLARHVLFKKKRFKYDSVLPGFRKPLYKVLLEPTRIYVKAVLDLTRRYDIKAIAHITGGGLVENIPRVLPAKTTAVLDSSMWKMPLIMNVIKKEGNIADDEMLRTFNCGIGMAIVVSQKDESKVLGRLGKLGENASIIGEIVKSGRKKALLKFT